MSEVRIHFDKAQEFLVWRGRIVHPNNRMFSRSWFIFQFSTLLTTLSMAIILMAFFNTNRWVLYALVGGGIIGDLVTIQKFKVLRKASCRDLSTDRAFPKDVTLGPAGLHIASALEDTKLSWGRVGNISDDKYGIALWLGDHAIPVPDRLLPEGWLREALRAEVERWWKAARL